MIGVLAILYILFISINGTNQILQGGITVQKEFINGFLAQLEERFEEADSNMTINLSESDTQYKALKVRLAELEREFPFIETVLDGNGVMHLTAEEHAGLVEYIRTTEEAENRERLNLYYAGHRDCFAYLKKIGVL